MPRIESRLSIDNLPQRTRDYLDHGAAEGSRNAELFAAEAQFRDAGFNDCAAHGYLVPRAVRDGLSEAEATSTINSAYAREAREPLRGSNSFQGSNGSTSFHAKPSEADKPKAPPKAQALPKPIPNGFGVLLETCFKAGEGIALSDTKPNASGEHKPGPGDVRTREEWLNEISQRPISQIYPNHRPGLFIRINPIKIGGKADKVVTSFRHVLVEFDLDADGNTIPKELQ